MSGVEALVRMVLAMGVVLGLLWATSKVLRAKGGLGPVPAIRRGQPAALEVLARQPLTRTSAVALVRAGGDGGKAWLVGVTEQQITLLSEAELPTEEPADEPAPARPAVPTDLGQVVELLRAKTARR